MFLIPCYYLVSPFLHLFFLKKFYNINKLNLFCHGQINTQMNLLRVCKGEKERNNQTNKLRNKEKDTKTQNKKYIERERKKNYKKERNKQKRVRKKLLI